MVASYTIKSNLTRRSALALADRLGAQGVDAYAWHNATNGWWCVEVHPPNFPVPAVIDWLKSLGSRSK